MMKTRLVASVAVLLLAPVPAFAFVPFLFIPAAGAALAGAAAGAATASSGIGVAGRSAAGPASTGSMRPVHSGPAYMSAKAKKHRKAARTR